jgi:hypothetical protein
MKRFKSSRSWPRLQAGFAGEVFQGGVEAGGVAGEPAAEELQQLGELGCVTGIEPHIGHMVTAFRGCR